ncbi:hypothetical protein ABNN70_04680 [Sporolactobacillus sp. Y61]|uniref:Uncharacterized protein n=1 Tax=Sporolactobacillus sp. Y61 TaxID=3160863 RepID=A0AAU8IHX4_9BACL
MKKQSSVPAAFPAAEAGDDVRGQPAFPAPGVPEIRLRVFPAVS